MIDIVWDFNCRILLAEHWVMWPHLSWECLLTMWLPIHSHNKQHLGKHVVLYEGLEVWNALSCLSVLNAKLAMIIKRVSQTVSSWVSQIFQHVTLCVPYLMSTRGINFFPHPSSTPCRLSCAVNGTYWHSLTGWNEQICSAVIESQAAKLLTLSFAGERLNNCGRVFSPLWWKRSGWMW